MTFNALSHFIKGSLIICFVLIYNSSLSQSNQHYFNELDIQGKSFNKSINVLFEDSFGFLWIGTNTGLYKYDGNELIEYQYNVFNPHSIPNNSINSIVEDANKNLWIGSESYLIHFNRNEVKFKGYYKNITSTVLQKAANGNIWANARNTGLILIEPNEDMGKIKLDSHFNYDNPNLLKFDIQINTLSEDNFGRKWIGTPEGNFILDKNNKYVASTFKKSIRSLKTFGNNRFIAITDKDLYILGYNKTDYSLEILEQYLNIMIPFGLDGVLNDLTINPCNENIWIGTSQGLIKALRTKNSYNFSVFLKGNSKGDLLNDQISSVIFDSYNNLWIGSSKGINKQINRTSIFEHNKIPKVNKFNNSRTNTIYNYSGNTVLVGMQNGLYRFNPRNQNYQKVALPFNNVDVIEKRYENDNLLIANGNTLYETEEYKPVKHHLNVTKVKTFDAHITDIAVINGNEIIIGIWGKGIRILNSENELSKFKKRIITKLAKAHISNILLTQDNELWIGTRGEGLFKVNLNNETFEEYLPSVEDGLTSNAILCVFEDSKKNVWIGTRGGGLNKYIKSTNSFEHFGNTNSSIKTITVCAIQEDSGNNIWMSTKNGLVRFDVLNEKFIPFGDEDGIVESEFTYNSSSSSNNKEKLYFGCPNGFYTVNPNNFSQKDIIPTTVITRFSTLGATNNNGTNSELNLTNKINVNSKSPIILPYDQNNIVVNFSSLDLTIPNKNEYAYTLEGLNDYWVFTNASNRNANYNDLSPGEYIFKVKSSNSDGIWNETPTILNFKIKPPFWKSNWAIFCYWLLATLIIIISSILIRRWYNLKKNLVKETISREKDNEHNRMKMVFFTDISHELRTPLSLILGTIEKVIKEKKFTLSPHTSQRIYNNTLRMHRLINQIMDIRKFDVGKFKLSISKNDIAKDFSIIKDSFNDFARIHEIKYEFIYSEVEIKGWYDVDILEKTLFNLLSNAFKYTKEKGEITVSLQQVNAKDGNIKGLDLEKNTYIKCVVRDNGMGISKKDLPFIFDRYYQATKSNSNQIPGTGIGMELVHKLIERHHGIISVESEENVFTEFTFYLPINKDRFSKSELIKTAIPLKKSFINNSEFQVIEEVTSKFNAKVNSKEHKNPKVLIIEDNEDLRRMVKEELQDEFNIIEASNGKEGYEHIIKENPLLIISDILMPVEDGISMLKRVKNNPEINNIPIFMLTAKNSEETKIECLALGADDYIEKPFSLEFVKWKVRNTLIRRKELKEKFSKVITTEPSEINIDSNDDKFIKKLIKIIENSMGDNLLSVEYLASEVGMSRANLYRKLQVIINDTPVNFIKKIRLKRAAQFLKKNDIYISEVAYMTGFNNQKYFGKCFSKEYGMSPTEYIKKYGEKPIATNIDFS
jgi:signal transduction histidine kinase/ligand-binding sensor domain-containing protein/AraC-like DNA-binding protein